MRLAKKKEGPLVKINSQTLGYSLLGLFIGVGLLIASYIVTEGLKAIKFSDQTLAVKGYAEKEVTADYGRWTGTIIFYDLQEQNLYQKMVQARDQVTDFLIKKGFSKEDFKFGRLLVYARYTVNDKGITTNKVDDYQGSFEVKIESDNVEKIAKIGLESSELLAMGVSLHPQTPQYLFRGLNDLKIALLKQAAQDAQTRAKTLVQSVGNELGPLRSAKQGVFQLTARYEPIVTDDGILDTTSIQKTVKAVVTMVFSVKEK